MSVSPSRVYRFAEYEFQPLRRALLRNGEKIAVAPKTLEVLRLLVLHAGEVVTKDELLKAVWPDSFVEESNLSQHVFWLRKALRDRSGYLVTVSGRGYQFIGPVEVVDDVDPAPELAEPVPVRVAQPVEAAPETVSTSRGRRYGVWKVAAVGGLLAVSAAAWGWWAHEHGVVGGDHHAVVLGAFANTTGNAEFDRTLDTLAGMEVKQSPYLVVAPRADVAKMLKFMSKPANQELTPEVTREVCQRLNDQVAVNGRIANRGAGYLVSLDAVDCVTGKRLLETTASATDRDGVLKAVDAASAEMRRRLGEPMAETAKSSVPLQVVPTSSLDALQAYTQGLALDQAGKCAEAIPLYEKAALADTHFAIAWGALSRCYNVVRQPVKSRAAIEHAYGERDRADAPYRFWITTNYNTRVTGNLTAVLANLEEWTSTFPRDGDTLSNLANLQEYLGRPELAVVSGRRAIALRPALAATTATVNLARSLMKTGQLDEAKKVCREAFAAKFDAPPLHVVLFDIATLEQNPTDLAEQVAWGQAHPGDPALPFEEARLAIRQGKMKAGVAMWRQAAQLYGKAQSADLGEQKLWDLTRVEAEMGEVDWARADIKRLGAVNDATDDVVNLLIARAETGDADGAEQRLHELMPKFPQDSDWNGWHIPQTQAAIALSHGQAQRAVDALRASLPYDLRDYEAPSARGRAYLEAHDAASAAAEFRKVIDHPGVDPASYDMPLARLGLARALAIEGNRNAARQEYEAVLGMWKDADADLPPLMQARAEYAAIR